MLKPLPTMGEAPRPVDPPRTCEGCGTIVSDGSRAINVILCIGVAGHPAIAGFQCPHIEHWACTPECWGKVAHACVDEHMLQLLKYLHEQQGISQ